MMTTIAALAGAALGCRRVPRREGQPAVTGLPPAATDYEPRLFFGAPLEPRATVLHGAGQDFQGFVDYARALAPGRQPVLYMTYLGIYRPVDGVAAWGQRLRDELARLESKAVIPQIGLMMGGKRDQPGREAAVARGEQDAQIEAFGAAVAALDRPALVRIGYEFDGPWNAYQPASFKPAFVRVAERLRERAPQAVTVWNAAGCDSLEKLMEYYPGDEWVDWWSVNLFGRRAIREHTPRFCAGAREHGRPVMIGESTPQGVGVLEGGTSWDAWFAPYFAAIRAHPEIKAFCYINWEWRYWSDKTGHQWHNWGDARIEQNEEVTRRYRAEMDLPLYEHAK